MKIANYRHIALSYDQGRPLSEQNIDLWLRLVARFSKMSEGARVLDLGCGTGRFSIPMVSKLRFHVTGADSSEEMLGKAREKDTGRLVKWDLEDAQHLTYPDESFNIIFMSHLLHHVDDPTRVLSECRRVLVTPGVILIRYGAIEQIRDDVEHMFFPEVRGIDEARTPTVATVEKWLAEANFHEIASEEVVQKTFETGEEHLNMARLKGTSVLTMISPEAFEKGIHDLTSYIEDNPDDPWLLHDRITLTVGCKFDVKA
ncbi:MAG: methyltransferase domain-containing protein [Dehalococcoidales bacterium]|nr:MAG: methyltransferase domain-containing protein [Dehalococcoidales bacterium]